MRCVVGLLAFSRPGSIPLPPLPVTVDSHLHLWPTTSPLVPPPPSPHSPCDAADAVIASSTDFSIVTQPIQLGHDHSYLADEIAPHKTLYGVALFDPTQPEGYEIDAYNALQPSKFIGMRFDPSLHPPPLPGTPAVPFKTLHIPTLRAFKHLGERHDGPNPTNAPNGVASFLFTNSLTPNYDALLELISASPTTPVVLDHFAFAKFTREGDVSFQLMLDLLKDAPSVNVRVSAGFRMFVEHPDPAIGLQVSPKRLYEERIQPLLAAVREKCLYGSDWPFVEDYKGEYERMRALKEPELMGGNAMKLYNIEKPGL